MIKCDLERTSKRKHYGGQIRDSLYKREEALLELAQIISEAQNGEVVRTEDK